MRRILLVAALLVLPLVPFHGASGATFPDAEREALHAYMVSLQGLDYDPLAIVTVTWGYYPDLQTDTMTAEEAIDLYITHIQSTDQELCANPTHSDSDVPENLVGTICFHEQGYIVTDWTNTPGATCPTYTPALAEDTLDILGGDAVGVEADPSHVGTMSSSVSLFGTYTPRFGPARNVNSRLVVFPGESGVPATEYSYGGSTPNPGHTLEYLYVDWAWLDTQIGESTFSGNEILWVHCWTDPNNTNLLHNDSIVTPRAWH